MHPATARRAVAALVTSKIREIANAGLDAGDVLAFWFGEPDEVTPQFIRQAAGEALAAGETFYTHNLGLGELRAAIAAYVSRLHQPAGTDRIAVTASGMSALAIAFQALVDPGDRVVAVTPVWPNLVEIPKILSARVDPIALRFGAGGWTLDLDRLLDALTPATRVLVINSPNNPTGWTVTPDEQRAIFERCHQRGIWIVADDVYERLYYRDHAACAPSFLDFAPPEARIVSTNSFSKAWLMTGFRLGWIVAPSALVPELATLIEYNTSCSPAFVQRAGVAAIEGGEATVAATRARFRRARDRLVGALAALPEVDVALPPGAMYAFFRIHGVDDSLAFCRELVVRERLGLAPGSAFGPDGEGFVRWCFAASDERLDEGVARLARHLRSRTVR
ncbi:MAG: pyridoxal phosphate-dependent aminotransferase [Proteobacteria bacterium]|nr:pyridoxal phosphate-dependent aminotransferase [Pseudomonadota bacterium]